MSNITKLAWHIGLAMGMVSSVAGYGLAVAEDTGENLGTSAIDHQPITRPLGVSEGDVPPNVMFVMGRDHNLFTAAYPDYTPLDDNGHGDDFYSMFHPDFNYEGMYATDMCYTYESNRWVPRAMATEKTASSYNGSVTAKAFVCTGNDKGAKWSGNFLNYLTASRMDVIKVALYGGTRQLKDKTQDYYSWPDGSKTAILNHTAALIDAHSWGKVFSDKMFENYPNVPKVTIEEISGLSTLSGTNPAYFFGVYTRDGGNYDGSSKMRIVQVDNANVPGEKGTFAKTSECDAKTGKCAVWTWTNQESTQWRNFKANEGNKNTWATKQGDYLLDVVACNPDLKSKVNNNCVKYEKDGKKYYQPEGIIQQYGTGSQPSLLFGLITGGWDSNRAGALLRDNISNKNDEFDSNTGEILYKWCGSNRCGFAGSLDSFKTIKKDTIYSNCGRSVGTLNFMSASNGGNLCGDWGNPIAELLYQSVNYFQNMEVKRFGNSWSRENAMTLGCVGNNERTNPYTAGTWCAKAVSFVISDEAPTFDAFGQGIDSVIPTASGAENVFTQGMITAELKKRFTLKDDKYLVGLSASATVEENHYKAMPTVKTVKSLADVTGIAPTQAFSYGSYNVAGVASLALGEDVEGSPKPLFNKIRNQKEGFNMRTFVLAMKPNMPEIKIPVKNGLVRLIPLAKTPAEAGGISGGAKDDDASTSDSYKKLSTNQIVGFYIQYNNETEGLLHVSFEDFQYGSDFDMDWVVGYKYKIINGQDDNQYVQITMTHEDGDIYTPQHGGYVITGVDYAGTYLDLAKSTAKNQDNEQGNFYSLDNYISDGSYQTCKSYVTGGANDEEAQNSFLQCLINKDARLPSTIEELDANIGNIDEYYNTMIGFRANSSTGEICTTDSADCLPIYYMPRYMFSRYAEYYMRNGKSPFGRSFFDFNKDQKDVRLIGDYYRLNNYNNRVPNGNGAGVSFSSRIFRVSKGDVKDVWLKSPLWYAAKAGYSGAQRSSTSSDVDPVNFSYVTNPAEFREKIRALLNDLLSSYHSASSFVPSTTTTSEQSYVYSTSYNPANWFGTIYKSKINNSSGSYDQAALGSLKSCWDTGSCASLASIGWNAAFEFAKMDPDERLIVTYDRATEQLKRVKVTEAEANDTTKTVESLGLDLFGSSGVEHPSDQRTKYFIRWLAGDSSHEGTLEEFEEQEEATSQKVILRKRTEGDKHFVLGDVINSDVAVVTVATETLLAVGANDGMLHILNEKNGKPLVSFIPTAAREKIMTTANVRNFSHLFYVDSTPKFFTKRDSAFTTHTYLYGSFGLNFKGGYLLDLTKVFSSSNSNADLRFSTIESTFYGWETTEADSDLVGQSREAPVYYSVNNKDYLLFSSGYNARKPGIYIVKAFDDTSKAPKLQVVSEIPLGTSTDKAISPIEIYAHQDMKGDVPAYMYAGDTEGNLYQVKLEGAVLGKPECWGFTNRTCVSTSLGGETAADYEAKVVFKATDPNGNPQPITARPAVGNLASAGFAVLFGTGSYWTPYDASEASNKQVQTMYCLKRNNGSSTGATVMSRNDLIPLRRTSTGDCVKAEDSRFAESTCKGQWAPSTNTADIPKLKNGWYMDLNAFSNTDKSGERIYRAPLVVNGNVYVVSSIPVVDDKCVSGGRSYLYRIKVESGITELLTEIAGLANEMSVTVHNGDLVVHVPYDGESATGAVDIPLKEERTPNMRDTSWIRLY